MKHVNNFESFGNVNEKNLYYPHINREDILEIDLLLNNSTLDEKLEYIKAILMSNSDFNDRKRDMDGYTNNVFNSKVNKMRKSEQDADKFLNDIKNYYLNHDSKNLWIKPLENSLDGYHFQITKK